MKKYKYFWVGIVKKEQVFVMFVLTEVFDLHPGRLNYLTIILRPFNNLVSFLFYLFGLCDCVCV